MEAELGSRGFRATGVGNPGDLELSYSVRFVGGERIRSVALDSAAAGVKKASGNIVIEARDPATKELVWHSAANVEISAADDPGAARSLLAAVAKAMLRALPPII